MLTLINQKIKNNIPKLGEQEKLRMDEIEHVKFFTPDSSWTWYVTEFDGNDTFFGLVDGLEKELGYFYLSELEDIRGPFDLKVERDIFFEPTKIKNLL